MRFVNYDDVVVRDNVQPTPANRHMSMVDAVDSCNITSVNNDLGAPGSGQLITGSRRLTVAASSGLAVVVSALASSPFTKPEYSGRMAGVAPP